MTSRWVHNQVQASWGGQVSETAGAATTEHHRLGGLNSRRLFLTVLEAGHPRYHWSQFLGGLTSWLVGSCLLARCSRGVERALFLFS